MSEDGRNFFLQTENARERMAAAWALACSILQHGKTVCVRVSEVKATRSLEQNAKMWAVLSDIAEQVEWEVTDERGVVRKQYLLSDDWKQILTAALTKHQRQARGAEGGLVMLGTSTSRMRVGEMAELIELAQAFGAEHGVRFGDNNGFTANEGQQEQTDV